MVREKTPTVRNQEPIPGLLALMPPGGIPTSPQNTDGLEGAVPSYKEVFNLIV